MYSIPENLDAPEFRGWINQDLLLKDSRRTTTTNRKRNYDLGNVNIEEQCEDVGRRVLRPRNNSESQASPGASRTRPIRSNRARRRLVDYSDIPNVQRVVPQSQEDSRAPDPGVPTTSSELSFIQAMSSYHWPQNYLLAHTDPALIQRPEPPTYPQLSSNRLGPQLPHFDPWVLHNYLLASSGYSGINGAYLQPHEPNRDEHSSAHVGYHAMVSENVANRNIIWQYPFLLNPSFNPIPNQVAPTSELNTNMPNNGLEQHSNLPYLYRSTRDSSSNSSESNLRSDRIRTTLNQNEHSNFNTHVLPNPFSYAPFCPYHNTSHIIQSNAQNGHPLVTSSSTLPEQQYPASFNSFPDLSFGHYWHQIAPVIRPVNYPINSSNIDTLLHLAAHFEQRKRGITREELDKLPTHRHKVVSEKSKRAKICIDKSKVNPCDDSQKCLVCLEDFESKQSIRTLRCKHEFHAKCIDKWLKINRTCPLCRADSFDGSAQKDGS